MKDKHMLLAAKAKRQIEHYSEMVARTARPRVARRAGRKLIGAKSRQLAAHRGIQQAGRLAAVGRATRYAAPIGFAAWDVWDALRDLGEDWAAAAQ